MPLIKCLETSSLHLNFIHKKKIALQKFNLSPPPSSRRRHVLMTLMQSQYWRFIARIVNHLFLSPHRA